MSSEIAEGVNIVKYLDVFLGFFSSFDFSLLNVTLMVRSDYGSKKLKEVLPSEFLSGISEEVREKTVGEVAEMALDATGKYERFRKDLERLRQVRDEMDALIGEGCRKGWCPPPGR